jgi:hypothetical protein
MYRCMFDGGRDALGIPTTPLHLAKWTTGEGSGLSGCIVDVQERVGFILV